MIKSISKVGGFTLLSRLFGLVRDLMMTRYLGAGMASDAFIIAFKLPNFFRRLFAEGAFTVGFVPLFARALGKDISPASQQAAEVFAGRVLSWLLPILLIFLVIMEVGMVPVMLGLTGGFDGDQQKFNFVVELGRYVFPYLLLISLVAFFGGILNALGRYSAAAFAPVILNLGMIAALFIYGGDSIETARALAIAVSISGLCQFLWLYISARHAGVRLSLTWPKLSPDVKEMLMLIGPAAIGAGVMQINIFIDVLLAARFLPEGSVTWLFFADRLNQLPLGVIGIAVGTVLLPSISRLLAAKDEAGANLQQNRALEFSLFLTLPAAAALAVIAGPVISTLFERGAFSAADTAATANALFVYALGLPAYVIAKALTPGYFARKDTKTPVRFAVISLVINTTLNLILIQYWQHVGLAAATAVAAWVNAGLLYRGLAKRDHLILLAPTKIRIVKFATASVIMAAAIWALHYSLADYFSEDGSGRILALTMIVAAGATVYLIASAALRTFTLRELKAFVCRSG